MSDAYLPLYHDGALLRGYKLGCDVTFRAAARRCGEQRGCPRHSRHGGLLCRRRRRAGACEREPHGRSSAAPTRYAAPISWLGIVHS